MPLPSGSRVGPYEIVAPLGAGGMGEVYRARDPRLKRDVAIKILPDSFSKDPDRLRRFEQEAEAASALNHPNILVIYDIGASEGIPFIVSELLDGETLRSRLSAGAFPPRKALAHALQIAYGLAAAHEKGIVHRDLKPENVFVTRDERVKILDFGLAKLTEPAQAGTSTNLPTVGSQPGVALGTLGYMSPEQVRGLSVDGRSDIFSFGAILYELLAGRRAFHGHTAADTTTAILKEEPPELAGKGREFPPGVERIVRHCLEKDPAQRFQSARDLAFDLESLSDLPVPSRRPAAANRRTSLLLALFIGGVVLAGGLLWRRSGGRAPDPGQDRKSIAVLPFQNLSPDAENAFFADGMTEDILTQLAKIRDLKVISRSSVMRYKGSQKPIQTIANELGVATVLEGSVRRSGTRVRIVGQLIDARTDEHLWADTYDRDLKDVFAIQGEVAQQIAGALRATLSPLEKRRLGQQPTQNLTAYDLYLKGRDLYYHYRKADNDAAVDLFQRALALDPGFALAYAGLGDSYAQRALRFGYPQSWLQSSLDMSRKAIGINSDLAEGYKAIGLADLALGAYRESLDASRRAVEINPNFSVASYDYGAVLRALGRFDEALPRELNAIGQDPKNPIYATGLATLYDALGDEQASVKWLKHSLELQPELGQAHDYLMLVFLGHHRDAEALKQAREALALLPNDPFVLLGASRTQLVTGDLRSAEPLLQHLAEIVGGTRGYRDLGAGVETHLAFVSLRTGNQSGADLLLEKSLLIDRLSAEAGNQDWSVPYDTACVHALRGEKDEAFRWLDKAVEAGWRGWPLLERDPLLNSVRDDQRFKALNARFAALIAQMRHRAGLS